MFTKCSKSSIPAKPVSAGRSDQQKAFNTIPRSSSYIALSSKSCTAARALASMTQKGGTYILNHVKRRRPRSRASFVSTGRISPMSVVLSLLFLFLKKLLTHSAPPTQEMHAEMGCPHSDVCRYQQSTRPSRPPSSTSSTSRRRIQSGGERPCDASRSASGACTK